MTAEKSSRSRKAPLSAWTLCGCWLILALALNAAWLVKQDETHVWQPMLIDDTGDPEIYYVDSADFDGDGYADLVTLSLAGNVAVYRNRGGLRQWHDGQHVAFVPGAVAVECVDIDGDGIIDMVLDYAFGTCPDRCRDDDGKLGWLRNPASPPFDM
jgi:hypothetical protein